MKLVALLALVLLAACPNKSRNESVKASNEGTKAYGARQYETATQMVSQELREQTRWSGVK